MEAVSIPSIPRSWEGLEARPMKWSSPQELEEKIEAYFKECDETVVKRTYDRDGNVLTRQTKPYTITGLALALDTTRSVLADYDNGVLARFTNASTPEEIQCAKAFSYAVKKAKQRCENWLEEHAVNGLTNPIFSIFSMKNNYGWTDKTEVEMKHSGTVLVEPISYALPTTSSAEPVLAEIVDDTPKLTEAE